MRVAPAALADMAEKEWDHQLFGARDGLATTLGWTLRYHTLRSKGSRSGFPDRVIVRERIIFAELKREKTGPTDDQIEWLDKLAAGGGEVYLWRPSDLEEIAKILSSRWEPAARGERANPTGLWTMRDGYWQPGSLWMPGQGRHDTTIDLQQSLLGAAG